MAILIENKFSWWVIYLYTVCCLCYWFLVLVLLTCCCVRLGILVCLLLRVLYGSICGCSSSIFIAGIIRIVRMIHFGLSFASFYCYSNSFIIKYSNLLRPSLGSKISIFIQFSTKTPKNQYFYIFSIENALYVWSEKNAHNNT